HVVKKAGAVLNYYFQKSAVRGGGIVEAEARLNSDFRRTSAAGGVAALQQRLERSFALQNVVEALEETLFLRRIQFQCAVQVGKMEGIQHDACRVSKGVCFDDVHAPCGKYAGDSGKKRRPIGGEQGERKAMPLVSEFGLQS